MHLKVCGYLFVLCIVTTLQSCSDKTASATENNTTLQLTKENNFLYDLNNPEKFSMPESLLEISGITFHPEHNDKVYAVQDEEGEVFFLKPGDDRAESVKFSKDGDFEDLAILNNFMIVLKSDGSFYSFPYSQLEKIDKLTVKEYLKILPEGEYESLYADNSAQRLYVLCKSCKGDKASNRISGYVLTVSDDGAVNLENNFQIDLSALPVSGKKNNNFKPSALTKNVNTNEWYILSSVSKSLVVTNSLWEIRQSYPLEHRWFIQPEGIAFDKQNNLYISNEGDDLSYGNILKFSLPSGK